MWAHLILRWLHSLETFLELCKRIGIQSETPTSSRQRASSWAFSLVNSSSGYCSLGNGATGQSNVGTSSLWMDLECVVAKEPGRSEKTRHSKWKQLSYKVTATCISYYCQIHGNKTSIRETLDIATGLVLVNLKIVRYLIDLKEKIQQLFHPHL